MPKQAPPQRIRYVRASDGVQLAWADASSGPVLVKAANWLTHLEADWNSPVWGHWIQFLCRHFRLVRYDERGCGMSDWEAEDLSLNRRVEDLETVIAAADLKEPFALLGISQGGAVCVAFAARHPERVSQLVLYGAHVRGAARRGNPEAARAFQAIIDLARFGWGQDNPAFRQVFTSRFIPGGDGRADRLVQRAVPQDDLAEAGGGFDGVTRGGGRGLVPRKGPNSDARRPRAGRPGRASR